MDDAALAQRIGDRLRAIRRGRGLTLQQVSDASGVTMSRLSRIELAWRESDQRDYFVPCPKCGEYQGLVFGDGTGPGLVWPEGKPEVAI